MSNKTAETLHGTTALTLEGDLAAQMVEVLDGYVTDAVAHSVEKRETLWHRDYSSHEAYTDLSNRTAHGLGNRSGALIRVYQLRTSLTSVPQKPPRRSQKMRITPYLAFVGKFSMRSKVKDFCWNRCTTSLLLPKSLPYPMLIGHRKR